MGTLKGEQSTFPQGFNQDLTLLHYASASVSVSWFVKNSIFLSEGYAVSYSCGSGRNFCETTEPSGRMQKILPVLGSIRSFLTLSGPVGIIRA